MFPFKKHAAQSEAAPLNEKLQQIRTQLEALNKPQAQGAQQVGGEGATLGDDAPLPADKRAAIAREETLVRGALKAVGVDYDALISTEAQEGKPSAYAAAVQANPRVLDEVLNAEFPTLKALEVAIGFKPYAEFVGKYGAEPAAIKAAILAEAKQTQEPPETAVPKGLPFSGGRGPVKTASGKPKGTLGEVFRK
jgi:hypothetical protein